MLVCLIPLGFFDLLSSAVVASDVAVVIANFVGYALTYELKARSSKKNGGDDDDPARVRTYQVYLEGARFGLVSKEGFDVLLELGLIEAQQTVEFVDAYKRQTREKGSGCGERAGAGVTDGVKKIIPAVQPASPGLPSRRLESPRR